MSDLILLYGLPGSGKSTQIRRQFEAGYRIFDDFMAGAVDNKPVFLYCQKLGDIITSLRSQTQCLIADIRLCDPAFRHEVITEIRLLVPTVNYTWHCFDCTLSDTVDRCRRNVRHRERQSRKLEPRTFERIDKFAPKFTIEPDAVVYEVVEASESCNKPVA